MEIINALQAKGGKKTEPNRMGSITQPLQFLPRSEKDEYWCSWNMDWGEWNGLKQLKKNSRRLMKNYKLAKGVIDRSDYIIEEDNEISDLIDVLTKEDTAALELKFYPIIPNVINVLTAEFAKRNTKITFSATDEFSYNEMLAQKQSQVEQVLTNQAEQKLLNAMIEQGMDPNDPAVQEQMKQQMSPENLKTLPEIQGFYDKSYRSSAEQWATHQHKVDVDRFTMDELEERAFRDMLITDREFWHFLMGEDDYMIELWNPVTTFYHKSPEVRYISQGNWVGKVDLMTIADVIDKYGYIMTKDQLESLEAVYPVRAAGYPIQGYQNDGAYYDGTKSHDWNTNRPSLEYRQFMSMYQNSPDGQGGDILQWIFQESEDYMPMGAAFLLRVTTYYWKSQRKLFHLTQVTEEGEVITDIVDETYVITDKPIYNTNLFKNKTKDNLIFGEHLDTIYVNETYGGVKIGPNQPSFWGMNNPGGVNPMYLGIDRNKVGPLKFQFKGDSSLYGCKLPVEGAVFSDRNTRSTAMVDLMKPFQIGYNIVNNQISDILIDELGTVILLDQNSLPRHSMGEDWGKNNLAKAYVAMKNFQMLPLDTSITNTENALNFQHFQTLDLEQTKRMMSRVQLATYFKTQAFEVIGLSPQRMGQQLGQIETASGMEQAVTGSYAQTEVYFIQHCDYLMPRVHQMRTDLAQYYQSTKPSLRLQYMTSNDERVNFEINGTDLLTRDLNVYATTRANHRDMLERLKKLATENNTAGASIYDLGNIMQAESLAEVNHVLKATELKMTNQRKEDQAAAESITQQEIQASLQEKQLELDHEAQEAEKNRRNEVLIAEIKSAGYGAMQDINGNMRSDYLDALGEIKASQEFSQSMGMETMKESNRNKLATDKMTLERDKLGAQVQMKNVDLQVAKENQTKSELIAAKKIKEQKKKK